MPKAIINDFTTGSNPKKTALLIMKGTQGFIQGIGNAPLSLAIAILDGVILRIFCSWYFGVVQPSGLGVFEFFAQYGLTSPASLKPDLWGFIGNGILPLLPVA